jgi:methionyl-tRNA synthetase
MPSFSAKVYEQLNIKRELKHETLLETFKSNPAIIRELVPEGHEIGTPEPIFSPLKPEQGEEWRAMFAAKKTSSSI